MPSEKKKCGACKDKLTREGYAKEQWQKEENERRCLACVASNRPNTAAQTPEEKAERDAFVKACVEALSRRSDVTNHTRATEARHWPRSCGGQWVSWGSSRAAQSGCTASGSSPCCRTRISPARAGTCKTRLARMIQQLRHRLSR